MNRYTINSSRQKNINSVMTIEYCHHMTSEKLQESIVFEEIVSALSYRSKYGLLANDIIITEAS